LLLSLLSDDSFVLAEATILDIDEALGGLEEVLIWLVRSEINTESLLSIGFYLGSFWLDPEWVLDPLASCLVKDIKKSPVDVHWEWVSIVQGDSSCLTDPS